MGLGFVAFGVAYLVDPHGMMELVGLQLTTATAAADVRAIYGGLQLAVGVFLLACARRDDWMLPGLLATSYVFSFVAGARIVGIARDRATDGVTLGALAVEISCAVIGAFAYRSESSRT
jgi:hypothetical protein